MPGRKECESMLKQTAGVIWLTGLSGSGKSTLANALNAELFKRGFLSCLLDGDTLRATICKDLGFSMSDRLENIRRTAEIARLMLDSGVIVIASFISPTNEIRALAKQIIGENDFYEVFVDCSLETCRRRDVKGLYKQSLQGSLNDFTGVDSAYERPENPWITIDTEALSPDASLTKLLDFILPKIKYQA